MDIIHGYNYLFDEIADPRVSTWPFMSGPILPLLTISSYLLLVLKVLPRHMKNREAYNLKMVIQGYNIFQVVSCAYLTYGIASSGWLTEYNWISCQDCDYSERPMAMRMAKMIWMTTMLKIIEYLETIFFILRKKNNQVSFLHLYHHSSTFMVCWLGTKYIPGGMLTFPVLINNFVHVFMYTYYFLSACGPEWQKKMSFWKSKLTTLQMVQFVLVFAHGLISLRDDCSAPNILNYIFEVNIVMNFILFFKFYRKSYVHKKVH